MIFLWEGEGGDLWRIADARADLVLRDVERIDDDAGFLMLEYKNWSYLVLPGMIPLIVSDKKILYLIESLTTLKVCEYFIIN